MHERTKNYIDIVLKDLTKDVNEHKQREETFSSIKHTALTEKTIKILETILEIEKESESDGD